MNSVQQTQSESSDLRFGRAVVVMREARQISQRAFVEDLAKHGLSIDASTLSRIEQGKRPAKLAEAMVIADALDVELDFLIGGTRTPQQDLKRRRRAADEAMRNLRRPLVAFISHYGEVLDHLRDYPELIEFFEDKTTGDRPTSIEDYPRWVMERLHRMRHREIERAGEYDDRWAYVEDEKDMLGILAIVQTYGRMITLLPGEEPSDGEYREEA